MKPMTLSTALTGLVIAAGAQLAGAQISFKPAANVAVGPQPDATAIADFNGDGLLDLAVANDNPDKVSFLFNQGNGTFGAPLHIQVGGGTSPHTPVAADLDGDGDMDVAVSLKNVNSVRILVNQGGGNFVNGATFGVGSEPRAMVAADFDNDGRPDVAVSNRESDNVSVLRNLGGLAFSVASFAAGQEPRELDAGDMTGDGLPDIAVAAHDSRQIIVLRSLGNGSFAQHAVLNMSSVRPEGVAVADLNGDGTRDIAASVGEPQFAAVWLNTGGGSFGGASFYALNGLDASSIVAADFDLDGDMDLATSNTDSNNVSVLANQGAGTFGGALLLAVGSQPGHIATGDLDKNGSPDLVTANDSSGNVSVLLNQTSGGSACATLIYCQGKVNSAGGVAQIGFSGTPSASAGNFSVNVSGALPGKPAIAFFGTNGPANQPFLGGTLCVTGPLTRLPVQFLSATGTASYFVSVIPAMAGTMRWYQFWHRDPAHPDGTGSSLSNALEVRFCD
jgi:hypothetical protein